MGLLQDVKYNQYGKRLFITKNNTIPNKRIKLSYGRQSGIRSMWVRRYNSYGRQSGMRRFGSVYSKRLKGKGATRSRGSTKSLVKLIRHVGTEAKRARNNFTVNASVTDEGAWTDLNTIIPSQNSGLAATAYDAQATGRKFYFKGMSFKFYAFNRSNIPFTCTVLICKPKDPQVRISTNTGKNVFYDPQTNGVSVTRASLAGTLHYTSPKISSISSLIEVKRFVFDLASTTRNQGTEGTEIAIEPVMSHNDIKQWSYYLPVEKELTQNLGSIIPASTTGQYILCFFCSPLYRDLTSASWDATKLPTLQVSGVQYWRD